MLSKITQFIIQNGYITFDQMMREVLSLHASSYYRHQTKLGNEGDFITAPEISQMFGEIIGIWCIEQWQKLGSPKKINLVELGPGRGLLMRDLLRVAKLVPEFYQAISIELIDINPNFIEQQKLNLKNFNLSIVHYNTIQNISKSPAIIIANEFFDALPIKQYVKIGSLWYESVFILNTYDDKIKSDKIEINKTLQNHFLKTHKHASDGAILEESVESIEIIQFIAKHIKAFGGSGLIIDYGYDINPLHRTAKQYNSTLQALKGHKYHSMLEDLGSADLSAHIDFYALKTAIEGIGVKVNEIVSQREFLLFYGILTRSKLLQATLSDDQKAIISRQVKRLISPEHMGYLFKVLSFYSQLI